MSIFACIYGFFHCSCTEKLSPCTVRMTQDIWSMLCPECLSNVRYLIPPDTQNTQWKTGGKRMRDAGMAHNVWICSRNSPCQVIRVSKCRDRLWQFNTAPDGMKSFPPSLWLQAWHSIDTFTHTHTHTNTNTRRWTLPSHWNLSGKSICPKTTGIGCSLFSN